MEQQQEKLNFFGTVKFLWGYMKGLRGNYILFYFGWLFDTVVGVVTPIVFGRMINQVIYERNLSGFIRDGLIFLSVTVIGILLYYGNYELYRMIWNGMLKRFRGELFVHMQRLSAKEMTAAEHGDMADMIQFQPIQCIHFMIRNVVHNINNIIRIGLCIGIIFRTGTAFGIVTLVLVPVSVLTAIKNGRKIGKNSKKNREEYARYISFVYEIAERLAQIRLWSAEKFIAEKFEKRLDDFNGTRAQIEMDNAIGTEVLDNIKNVILMIQYGMLAYYAVFGNMTIGTVTVMLSYFVTLSDDLGHIAQSYMDAQTRIAVIERIRNFLQKETADRNSGKKVLAERMESVSFRGCSFAYDGAQPMILNDVNFTVKKGETLAVVGASGAGKTTLTALLAGFYRPVSGQVRINEKDMRDYDPVSLYGHFSVVFQQVLFIRGTIRENLCMGKKFTEDALVRACQAAEIYEYIKGQEKGFDTEIERFGGNLSGGERQRLGLARAYLHAEDMIVMDEATSALDPENEERVLNHWEDILRDKICIVVSHRRSTVMRCDRVIFLKEGKIETEGTPHELAENCRDFQELFAI